MTSTADSNPDVETLPREGEGKAPGAPDSWNDATRVAEHGRRVDVVWDDPTRMTGPPAPSAPPPSGAAPRRAPEPGESWDDPTAVVDPADRHPSGTMPVDPIQAPLDQEDFDERYEIGEVLGEGGMGEVRVVTDRRIGRDVAIKLVRASHQNRRDILARFQREARVQGQLEHPSIVPVYDLGVQPDGSAYFTMKRVRGHTLQEIIVGLRKNDPVTTSQFNARRLLVSFSRVCLCIAYAHSRGVVHRDLKPANIILGDYGEVYVLDWGVAKVSRVEDLTPVGNVSDLAPASKRLRTRVGDMLGSPGYMAPEQVMGRAGNVDNRADLYSLGAILFELLTLQPLHPQTDAEAALDSTVRGADARARARAPERDVPEELEAICVRATMQAPEDRFTSAREMGDAIERYLDGDREMTGRKELARRHLLNAQVALAYAKADADGGIEKRARAIRELNAALALDPSDQTALGALMKVFDEAPQHIPREAEQELLEHRGHERSAAAKRTALAYVAVVAFTLVLAALSARNYVALGVIAGTAFVAAGFAWWMGAQRRTQLAFSFTSLTLGTAVAISLAMLFGPLVLVPSVALALALTVIVHSRAGGMARGVIIGISLCAFLLPLALQQLGVLPSSYSVADGTIRVLPWAVDMDGPVTLWLLAAASAVIIAVPGFLVGRSVDALSAAERRLAVQAWYLRQLVPDEARSATEASGSDPR